MQPIWAVLIAVIAFLAILHFRNRRRRPPPAKRYSRQIEGAQIIALLHPRVSRGCLTDHGMQFGHGFRRKQGPALPHDAECRCHPVRFSHSSSEVFNGVLRRPQPPEVTIEGLSDEEALALLELLRGEISAPAAGEPEEAALEPFAAGHREALAEFLKERREFLAETRAAHEG